MQSGIVTLVLAALTAATAGPASAQGIAAAVSPPRIEAQVNPGQTHRQIVEISHSGAKTGHYRVYTNDWSLQPDGGVVFTDKLVMGSCRPWVAIEKKELLIQPRGRHRYRFEIAVPPGAMAGECRFALMIEGVEPVTVDHGGIAMPVSGRMAVIVYASVGDAKPKMSVASHAVAEVQGQVLPVVEVRNDGNAHGRFDGALAAVDGEGNKLELVPSSFPILPGETRKVALAPAPVEGQAPAVLKFPLAVKGELEAGKDRLPLDLTFRR